MSDTDRITLGEPKTGLTLDGVITHALAILELGNRICEKPPLVVEFSFNGTTSLAWLGETHEQVLHRYNTLRGVQQRREQQRREHSINNSVARNGVDRCICGSKYWRSDRCYDCATPVSRVIA